MLWYPNTTAIRTAEIHARGHSLDFSSLHEHVNPPESSSECIGFRSTNLLLEASRRMEKKAKSQIVSPSLKTNKLTNVCIKIRRDQEGRRAKKGR